MLGDLGAEEIGIALLVMTAAAGIVIAVAMPLLTPANPTDRISRVTAQRDATRMRRQPALVALTDGDKEGRRRKVQEVLKDIELRDGKKTNLRMLLGQAGLDITVKNYWFIAAVAGLVLAVLPIIAGFSWYIGLLSGIVGLLGLPRWYIRRRAKRRQKAFREGLADSVDVMVRGLRAGLPLTEALRMIAAEAAPPIGPEFQDVVEGQRVGLTLDQGFERMFDRMPLPEVSFLGIVISIQSKTGGNLSEALANLSKILRDRKRMLGKIRSASQEAKDSAKIIGALPFVVIAALMFLNPEYLTPLFYTTAGHIVILCCLAWMAVGILIMRWMINFDI